MNRKAPRMNTVLLLPLVGTILLVLAVALLLFLQSYRTSLLANARTSSSRAVAQAAKTVEDYVEDTSQLMAALETALEDPGLDRQEFFRTLLQIRPDVIAVSSYDKDGGLVSCYSGDYTVRRTLDENLSFQAERMADYAGGYISGPHVVTLFEGSYPWAITMIAPTRAAGAERWAALDISSDGVSSYINDVGIGRRGYCFLMDSDGNIVYHPQQQLLYFDLKQENIRLLASLDDGSHVEGNVIYTLQTLSNAPWRVVGVSSEQELVSESLRSLARILLVSAVLILLAGLGISALLSRRLSRPLRELASAMKQFEQDADRFSYEPTGGAREVRELSASFDHMVTRIQRLMGTVRQEEINLRKTELRALQAQINPHFLYNTLDSISWMCEQGKNAEAVRMVNALARLFRISISRGHELIPIRSELQHAESYLQIQAYRYKNQFHYTFEVEESCLDYLCNKITLQPIIENAIYHGINGLVDDGENMVRVRDEAEDNVLTVADNGTGKSREQIRAVMSKERSDHAGIGIKNVNDRLKIYFGSAYGITIDSVPDEGTRVHIRMPKVREEAEYENR